MVIAVPASTSENEGQAEPRFGRAPYFYLIDANGKESFVENSRNLNAPQGAGIQSAQNLLEAGAEVLLSGHCGPKAFKVLTAGGVRIFIIPPGTSLSEAVTSYKEDRLPRMNRADVEGHWV